MNLTKYAQNLEHVIRFKNKEIQRLEYINKYLVISQQKRDEMLTHILEENRKLKELSAKPDKKCDKKLPTIYSITSPTQKSISALPKPATDDKLRKLSMLKQKTEIPQRVVEKDKTLNPAILLKGKKLLDEKKTQSILKMSKVQFVH